MLKENCATQCKHFPGFKWVLLLPILFLCDQAPKWMIYDKFSLGEVKPVLPFMQFTLAFNPGVAFSFFNQHATLGHILLISSISLVCLYLAFMLLRTPISQKWAGLSLALILGGALGNLWDRIYHGYVIDFVDFYIKDWHWYTFNIADCFITIGAFLLILNILFSKEPTK